VLFSGEETKKKQRCEDYFQIPFVIRTMTLVLYQLFLTTHCLFFFKEIEVDKSNCRKVTQVVLHRERLNGTSCLE